VEKRIQQLVAKQREAERREIASTEEAAYWRGIAEGRITPPAPVQPQSPAGAPQFPALADFERSEDFEEARTRYIVEKTKWDLRKEQEAHTAQEFQAELDRRHQERLTKAIAADPTLEEAISDPGLPISPPMTFVIKDSEEGPEIARYLADHKPQAERISGMHPLQAVREMGIIEGMLKAAKSAPSQPETPRTVSQAPEPVRPTGGTRGAVTTDDDEKVSIDEFIRRRNEGQYGKR
jgi:hypothetical protein